MSFITLNLERILQRISAACERSNRQLTDVKLIAVSKTFPSQDIFETYQANQRCYAESKLQEAEGKIKELPADIDWHFIGRVQRNKVRKILPLFSTIHAIDSLRLAEYTNGICEELKISPKIFLQVDLAGEVNKGGFSPEEIIAAMPSLMDLKHLCISGLMAIPPAVENPEDARKWFRELRILREHLVETFSFELPFLSMGMSGDFEIAIEEGATHVRVGSSIFGRRAYQVEGELGI